MAVDLGAELPERQEAGDVERDHELTCVGLAHLLGIDVLDVAPEGRAVERAGEQAQDQR